MVETVFYYFALVAVIIITYVLARRPLNRRLREINHKYLNTVENAAEGIVQTTREGKFLAANTAFAQMLDYESGAELMERVDDINHQIYVNPEVRQRFLSDLDKDGRARCEYEAFRKDGSTTWLFASSRVVESREGEFLYYESIVEDVSERRAREAELKEIASSLSRSNMELQRFAHTVAHDLMEPIRTVNTYVEMLARTYRDKIGPDAETHIGFITSSMKRLKNFIDDILAFSRVDWQSNESEHVDMNQVTREVLENLGAVIKESKAEIHVSKLPVVCGERVKYQRLFQNLMSNAIKFRGDNPPKISITSTKNGRRWLFTLQDNGIGFDNRHAERIFEFFSRLNDQSKYPGSGMGLAVCKRIVELEGGRIWAESSPGKGTKFMFTLPEATDPCLQPATPSSLASVSAS